MMAEHFCAQCGAPFLNAFPLDAEGRCRLCRLGARGLDAVYCYASYEGAIEKLIPLFKYQKVRTLARPLGELLLAAFPRDRRFDALVPVPLHWRKRMERGFNQSELLARFVSRRTGIPMRPLLKRVRNTSVQAGLSNAKRRENVKGAFEGRAALNGERILLIDDVMTTGATAAAAAQALRDAGAASVGLMALARVDRRVSISESPTQISAQAARAGAS